MVPGNPPFTPQQLLDAGQRAEGDGRADIAVKFYHELIERFTFAPEAADARDHLERLGAGWQPSRGEGGGPAVPPPVPGSGARGARRLRYPASRDRYRTGRLLAKLFSGLGWLLVLLGLGLVLVMFGAGLAPPGAMASLPAVAPTLVPYGIAGAIGASLALVVCGLVTVAAGQAARALFDHANATHELLAIERARAGAGTEM